MKREVLFQLFVKWLNGPAKPVNLWNILYREVKAVRQQHHRLLLFFENLDPACIVRQFSTGKEHFLVNMSNKSLRIHIRHRLKHLVFEVFLHFRDITNTLFRKSLKLCDVYIRPVNGEIGSFWQMYLFEQIMVVLCSRCKLYNHRHTYMILHYGVHFHPSFLLAGLRMTTYTFENVVKEGYGSGVHHV